MSDVDRQEWEREVQRYERQERWRMVRVKGFGVAAIVLFFGSLAFAGTDMGTVLLIGSVVGWLGVVVNS